MGPFMASMVSILVAFDMCLIIEQSPARLSIYPTMALRASAANHVVTQWGIMPPAFIPPCRIYPLHCFFSSFFLRLIFQYFFPSSPRAEFHGLCAAYFGHRGADTLGLPSLVQKGREDGWPAAPPRRAPSSSGPPPGRGSAHPTAQAPSRIFTQTIFRTLIVYKSTLVY